MKIRKSIENVIKKSAERKCFGILRQDIVRRAIENGEFETLECSYRYTDDYAWDSATDFGAGQVSKKAILDTYQYLKPSCWLRGQSEINGKQCYEINIQFHSNLSYSMHVPVA